MNYLKSTSILVIILLILSACKKDTATINGFIEHYDPENIVTYSYDPDIFDTITVQPDGKFTHKINLTEGTLIRYTINGTARRLAHIYVSPGSEIDLTLKPTLVLDEMPLYCVYELKGDVVAENNYYRKNELSLANSYIWPLKRIAEFETFKEWNKFVEESFNTLQTELMKAKNKKFVKENLDKIKYNRNYVAFQYIWAKHNIAGIPYDAEPDFTAFAESIDLNNPIYSDSTPLVDHYLRWYTACNPDSSRTDMNYYYDLIDKKIENVQTKNNLSKNRVKYELIFGDPEDVKAAYDRFIVMSTNEDDKTEISSAYEKVSKLTAESLAPDFELQDINGRNLKFSDLRGKMLYIDVWATWCGPCKMETPYFKKLAEKFANNSQIEFIAISIDTDIPAWKEYLEKNKSSYRNFLAPNGSDSELCTIYNIKGIPRFMLIDKDGKIITVNAERPSAEKMETFLKEQLLSD